MTFDEAVFKHSEWKAKFRAAIVRKDVMDVVAIEKDNYCDLGKWLYGDAKIQYGHLASYRECVAKHMKFHIEAGKIAAAINAKEYARVEAMIAPNSSYITASNVAAIAIMELEKDVHLDHSA